MRAVPRSSRSGNATATGRAICTNKGAGDSRLALGPGDHGQDQRVDDLAVGPFRLRGAHLGARIGDGRAHGVGRVAAGAAIGVIIPAGVRLAAKSARFGQAASHRDKGRLAPRPRRLALEGADVETGQVLHLEEPHRHAEPGQGGVDLAGRCPARDQPFALFAVQLEDAIADEPVADAGADDAGRTGASRMLFFSFAQTNEKLLY